MSGGGEEEGSVTIILYGSFDCGNDDSSTERHPESQTEYDLIAVYGRVQVVTRRGG